MEECEANKARIHYILGTDPIAVCDTRLSVVLRQSRDHCTSDEEVMLLSC